MCLKSSIGGIIIRLLLFHFFFFFFLSSLINYSSDTVTKKCAVLSLGDALLLLCRCV